MTQSLTIRPIMAHDWPDWKRLWLGYLQFYDTEVTKEVYRTAFTRLTGDDPQDFHGLIALNHGRAVGLVHYLFHRHMWRVENVCYLQDLYTDPAHRGTGAGRALIAAVYQAADAAGVPQVYWLTQEFNHTARRLYDDMGVLTPFIRYNRL